MSPATEGRLPFSIVPIAAAHREDWDALYEAYANFYRSTQTKEMRQRVWGWLNDETHELEGRIAVDANGRGVGLVHYRPFTRPLAAATAGYIDDLFVAPDRRGQRHCRGADRDRRRRGPAARLGDAALDDGGGQLPRPRALRPRGRPHRLADLSEFR